jgi:hypothetical protein
MGSANFTMKKEYDLKHSNYSVINLIDRGEHNDEVTDWLLLDPIITVAASGVHTNPDGSTVFQIIFDTNTIRK